MQRTTKIEHWRSQSRYPDLRLVYLNLLAACLGGLGQPEELQHCDTRKGDRDLKFNPANPEHRIDRRIRYEVDGTIASSDEEFNAQLNEVLGLNLPMLRNRRKSVLTGSWNGGTAKRPGCTGPFRGSGWSGNAHGTSARTMRFSLPSAPIVVWWLEQRLAKSAT